MNMDTNIKNYPHVPPHYQEALEFLQSIVNLQTTLAEKVVPSLQIDQVVARARWQAGLPLLTDERLTLSPSWFREAVTSLRSLFPAGEPGQVALDQLLSSDFMKPSDVEALLDDLRADTEAYIQRLADATSTAPDIKALLLRTILSPFFQKQIAPYREWFETTTWRRGICPMCGSEPGITRLSDENGQRFLVCLLCQAEWNFDRLRCPFCESDDQPQVRYFTVDEDQAHRVDCCDQCQRYIKTVDERVLGYPTNLSVENMITAHLDGLAREQGFQ